MANWKIYKLGELVDIIMGQSPEGSTCNKKGDGIPLLNGPTEFGDKYPKAVQYTTDPKRFSEKGDILFCVRGSTTGRMNYSDKQYAIGRGLAAMRHKERKELQPFVKGLIDVILPNMLHHVTGSTFPNLAKEQLNNFEVLIPSDLNTQSRIASILSSLDDKIELNRRMNQTLEQMAQTIFKKYFFEKGVKEVGLLEIASLLGGGTPKTEVADYWNGDIGWISAKDVGPNNNSFIIKCERRITQSGLNQSSAKLLPQFSTVITARGTVGNICIIPEAMAISQSNYALKSKVHNCDFVLFQIIQLQLEELKRNSYGTIFDTITTNTLKDIKVLIPEENVFLQIEKLLKPVYFRILNNLEENNSLSEIRNTLLPKLMSGEIDVDALAKKETLLQEEAIEYFKTT